MPWWPGHHYPTSCLGSGYVPSPLDQTTTLLSAATHHSPELPIRFFRPAGQATPAACALPRLPRGLVAHRPRDGRIGQPCTVLRAARFRAAAATPDLLA
jgi:hypothetical protein